MIIGLSKTEVDAIRTQCHRFPEIKEAILFGSRAMGNHKKASDVDIAIKGEQVTLDTVASLKGVLEEETPLPYFFDVTDYHATSNQELKQHIDEHGVVIYE